MTFRFKLRPNAFLPGHLIGPELAGVYLKFSYAAAQSYLYDSTGLEKVILVKECVIKLFRMTQ